MLKIKVDFICLLWGKDVIDNHNGAQFAMIFSFFYSGGESNNLQFKNWKWQLDFSVKHQHLNKNWLPNYQFFHLTEMWKFSNVFLFKHKKALRLRIFYY